MAEMYLDNVSEEIRGHMYPGKLRLKASDITFRNDTTGKSVHFNGSDIDTAQWVSRATGLCLRVKLNNETVHRFDGFGEMDSEKVGTFFKKNYDIEISKRELSYKGFNWGDVVFEGNLMEFVSKNAMAFDIPLTNISNASANKNEVIFEFHPNDDAELCLSEMRFHTPSTETDKDGAATAIYNHVMQKADIIQVTGDSLVEFKDISYLQPRGRYDVKLYNSFIHLHGKSFDYKIPKSTIIRLLLLPNPDNRTVFFAAQVDPPLKHGQTRYHIIVMMFEKEKNVEIELSVSEEYLKQNYDGKIQQVMVGPEYDLFARLCKTLYNQKLTVPGSFKAKRGGSAVACSYKTYTGLLYPLERGFIFVPRPPVSIRFDEIVSVNFSRGTGALRSFDFDVETRMGIVHTFVSIERDEYHKLYDFVTEKRLRVKNIEDKEADIREKLQEMWSSSDESHDAYLNKVKAEGRERTAEAAGTFAGADFSDDDDEEDEDFNPPESGSGESVAEEYDSNAQSSNESARSPSSSEASSSSKHRHRHHHKKKPKSSSSTSSKPKSGTRKDSNAPSRPPSAYFLWFSEHRQEIKDSLGSSAGVTDVAKAAGEKWKTVGGETKAKYQKQADRLKEKYEEEMRVYKAKIASGEIFPPPEKASKKRAKGEKASTKKKSHASAERPGTSVEGAFKSSEFVEDSELSSLSDKAGKGDDLDSLSD